MFDRFASAVLYYGTGQCKRVDFTSRNISIHGVKHYIKKCAVGNYKRCIFSSGTTSLNGPGSLVHLGSLKCIHPQGGGDNVAEGTKLLIHSGCSESR